MITSGNIRNAATLTAIEEGRAQVRCAHTDRLLGRVRKLAGSTGWTAEIIDKNWRNGRNRRWNLGWTVLSEGHRTRAAATAAIIEHFADDCDD